MLAATWVKKAAEQGAPDAQALLAELYNEGQGVKKDHERGLRWMLMAAGQGLARAQYHAGVMLFYGRGISQDHTAGVRWIQAAAEQNFAPAQYILGAAYRQGAWGRGGCESGCLLV